MRKRQLTGTLYIAMFGMAGCLPDSSAVFATDGARRSYMRDEDEAYEDRDTSYGDWDTAETTIADVLHDCNLTLADIPATVTTKADFITWCYDNGHLE